MGEDAFAQSALSKAVKSVTVIPPFQPHHAGSLFCIYYSLCLELHLLLSLGFDISFVTQFRCHYIIQAFPDTLLGGLDIPFLASYSTYS